VKILGASALSTRDNGTYILYIADVDHLTLGCVVVSKCSACCWEYTHRQCISDYWL